MSRKVFISFLGTTNYTMVQYSFSGERSKPVRFVQEALIGILCKDWKESDQILIFLTEKSEEKNWLNDGHQMGVVGLEETLKNKTDLKPPVEKVLIPEGFNEDEIWEIFEKVYSKLKFQDEIYFDVTHAFRSIPLFSTVLFNFARTMKETTLAAVYYGAFEAANASQNPDPGSAPIIDLTGIARLQELNQTASNFIEFGKVGSISNAIQLPYQNKGQTKSQRKIDAAINTLNRNMALFDDYLLTCRMSDIRSGKFIKEIRESLNMVKEEELITKAEKRLLKKIEEDIKYFVSEDSDKNIRAAIDWAVKYNLTQQAYTLGQEYIITLICNILIEKNPYKEEAPLHWEDLTSEEKKKEKKRKKEREKDFRLYISSILSIDEKDIPNNFQRDLKVYKHMTEEILQLHWIKKVRKHFWTLSDNRNTLNHGKGDKSAEKIRDEFDIPYQACIEILDAINHVN